MEQVVNGRLDDVSAHIDRLLAVSVETAPILIIALAGSEGDFVRFSVSDTEVELAHPLVTRQQQAREDVVREAMEDAGCEPEINVGSDGARFVDCYIPRSSAEIAQVAKSVLRDVFAVDEATPLVFTCYGF